MIIASAAVLPGMLLAQEVCNNGIDDDGNGLIDLNDPACPCATALMPPDLPSYIRNHSFDEQTCCPYGFVAAGGPPWLACATGWNQATSATSDYFNECGYSPAGFNLPPPDGDGAVGFYAAPGYFEYVGTCLTYPAPSNPLIAGTTYTLSLWITCGAGDGQHAQTAAQGDPSIFTDQLPLALFGHANVCVEFPVQTSDCIGYQPGWNELGRVMVQPAWDWTRVSITFTPTQNIHTIMIGGGCDAPASFAMNYQVVDPLTGTSTNVSPYFIIDDLMLTEAQEQVLSPTSTFGTLCGENASVSAVPPVGATDHQWYLGGVALPGQTGLSLNVSQLGSGGGVYTLASTFNGECLMGSTYVPPAIEPIPWPMVVPGSGCEPLEVHFADTTGGATTVEWSLGDGSLLSDSSFTHLYHTAGSYDVRLTVRNPAGCVADTLLENAVVVYPGVTGGIASTPNPTDTENTLVELSGSASTSDIVSWWWDLGGAAPGTAVTSTLTADFPAVAGSYPVMLVVTTSHGCTDTVRSVVVVTEPGVVSMPNVFSPNGDGHNDLFIPLHYNGTPALLEVFNRWGQMIYSTRSLWVGWNGRDVPEGTYYYVVTPDDGTVDRATGHVTLVR